MNNNYSEEATGDGEGFRLTQYGTWEAIPQSEWQPYCDGPADAVRIRPELHTNMWDELPEATGEWEDPYEDLYEGPAYDYQKGTY